jgi:uncharacterized linocin/CFP29 family protein
MSDYLMRDDAPLSAKEWEQLDEIVISAARRVLVGRRFISLAGPLGFGTQVVPLDKVEGSDACRDDGDTCTEDDVVHITRRQFIPMTLIHKDFFLAWRDVEAAHQSSAELGLGLAAAAAVRVAQAEDEMIFQALLNADGRQTTPLKNWETSGNALMNVVEGRQALADAGFYAPYALVVSTALYADLQRVYKGSGRQEQKLVSNIADGGIFQSPLLAPKQALMISQGPYHLDLAVGQDMVTAYLGPEEMEHRFRVLETLALRVKHPEAICVFE